jgi:hypothetical protein
MEILGIFTPSSFRSTRMITAWTFVVIFNSPLVFLMLWFSVGYEKAYRKYEEIAELIWEG